MLFLLLSCFKFLFCEKGLSINPLCQKDLLHKTLKHQLTIQHYETFNWHRFYESFFGDPYLAWHDGMDVNALNSLTREEKEEAEYLLLDTQRLQNMDIAEHEEIFQNITLPQGSGNATV